MSYEVGGLIQATDYNVLATGSSDGTANHNVPNVNSLLGVGYGAIGYNTSYALLTPIPIGATITADKWIEIRSRINTLAQHQGTQIPTLDIPSIGATIKSVKPYYDSIQRIFSSASNSNRNSYTTANFWEYNLSQAVNRWKDRLELSVTLSFTSGESTRLFFNRGGSIQLDPFYNAGTISSNPTEATVSNMMTAIFDQVGQIYITGATSTNQIFAGTTTFKGVTQTLGTATGIVTNPLLSTVDSSKGYPSLVYSSKTLVLTQAYTPSATDLTTIPKYCTSGIKITVETNGGRGTNGDNGNSIKISTTVYQRVTNMATQFNFNNNGMSIGAKVRVGYPPTFTSTAPTVSSSIYAI